MHFSSLFKKSWGLWSSKKEWSGILFVLIFILFYYIRNIYVSLLIYCWIGKINAYIISCHYLIILSYTTPYFFTMSPSISILIRQKIFLMIMLKTLNHFFFETIEYFCCSWFHFDIYSNKLQLQDREWEQA